MDTYQYMKGVPIQYDHEVSPEPAPSPSCAPSLMTCVLTVVESRCNPNPNPKAKTKPQIESHTKPKPDINHVQGNLLSYEQCVQVTEALQEAQPRTVTLNKLRILTQILFLPLTLSVKA